jgi:PKD repeat protein
MKYFFYIILTTCLFFSCSKNVSSIEGNNPPFANLIISPASGHIFTSFVFDASASNDPDESSYNLLVRWDWENDGIWDTGYAIAKMVTHKFASEGTKTVKIEVMDSEGLTDSATTQVSVSPPI